ncbi:DUF3558 domain-containing protein [Rhodococcoides yunnanense]|uniref:DUF3558 domain-containing protein n=1 Tax=Rhodococcoides yunnanense TaxID=278209 RepID=UPI0009327D57|nr:DUF3558 domain-containing protein [Rhodococcus yunnanensis]
MQRRGVATLAAVLLASACGNGVGGTPVAGAPAEPWDPCSIPTQVIETTGLDPTSKKDGWPEGLDVDDWRLCTWQGPQPSPWYFFSVRFSTDYTLDDAKNDVAYLDLADISAPDRGMVSYRTRTRAPLDCNVAVDAANGTAKISLDVIGSASAQSDPCQVLLKHANDVLDQIPLPTT